MIVKLSGGSMIGALVGELAAQAVSQTKITGEWLVDLRTVCAVGSVVLVGAWQVRGWQKNISDRLMGVEDAIRNLPCHIRPITPKDCHAETSKPK